MSNERSAPDLHGLEDHYVIRGELRGADAAHYYIGSTRDGADEVAINVVREPKGGENNALSHLAADAQILSGESQPLLARVLEGRWVGPDTFAIVTERVPGETLGEQLERGERFGNARIAMLLQEVAGALEWAREHGVVHRGITPDSLIFERDTNRVRVMFTPTPIPMSGVPDACTDARTIAMLAWAMLTGERYAEGESPRSLGEVCPNLATRVVESTDKMLHCKDHVDTPDIGGYLATLAAGDVMKQAEVELAALKEEYDEQHRLELQKCELHRQETEQHAAEQVAILAGEREELERQIAEERAALAAERADFERLMEERKERLAGVRAELDQQRGELERRLAELEAYRAEVEKVRDDAIVAREEAKAAAARAAAAFETASAAAAAAAAASAANTAHTANTAAKPNSGGETVANRSANAAKDAGRAAKDAERAAAAAAAAEVAREVSQRSAPAQRSEQNAAMAPDVPPIAPAPVIKNPYEKPVKLAKPPKAPKWHKMQPVDLDRTDIDSAPAADRRPGWMIPAGIAVLALIVIAVVFNLTHRTSASDRVQIGKSTVVPTAPSAPTGIVPRGGFLTQSAGGNVAPALRTSPIVDSANPSSATTSGVNATGGAAATNDLMNPAPTTNARPTTTEQALAAEAAAAARRAARPTTSNSSGGTTSAPPTTTNTNTTSSTPTFSSPTTTAPIQTPPAVVTPPIRPVVPTVNTQSAARAAQARADSEAQRRRMQALYDSLNSPASSWNKPDTTTRRRR